MFEARSPVPRGLWLALEHGPVHQCWPAEHLLLSSADKLHFRLKPKDIRGRISSFVVPA